jgi:hypothetical protein
LNRQSEHFHGLFNSDRVVQDTAVLRIPQQSVKAELDELLSVEEITKAIDYLNSGKAAELTVFHQRSGKMEDQHFTASSTNSLSVVGSMVNFQETSAMQSSSPCTKTREKSQTAPTIGG